MPESVAKSRVPEGEISLVFVRSSGPGGQNVNKTSTKAQLRWHVGGSQAFSEEQKSAIRKVAGGRLNGRDEIVLSAEDERSQAQNRASVIQRLQQLVGRALAPKKIRKPSKVSRAQKRRRLDEKRKIGEKKSLRKSPQGEW